MTNEKTLRVVRRLSFGGFDFDYRVLAARDDETIGMIVVRWIVSEGVDVLRTTAQQGPVVGCGFVVGLVPYTNAAISGCSQCGVGGRKSDRADLQEVRTRGQRRREGGGMEDVRLLRGRRAGRRA